VIVDARNTVCPYPVVELGRAAREVPAGAQLRLLADDPVALTDVPAWCRMRQAHLEQVISHDGYWEFVITTPGQR
jgi:tRNA 2-thiouridine synthesizing protein A